MARRMVVVPYDMVKDIIKLPQPIQRVVDNDTMTRQINTRFPDDFGKPVVPEAEVKPDIPAKAEESKKVQRRDRKSTGTATDPFVHITSRLAAAGVVNSDGQVLEKGKVIKRSSIDDILRHIASPGTTRPPVATQNIRRALTVKELKDLGTTQQGKSGSQWIF